MDVRTRQFPTKWAEYPTPLLVLKLKRVKVRKTTGSKKVKIDLNLPIEVWFLSLNIDRVNWVESEPSHEREPILIWPTSEWR